MVTENTHTLPEVIGDCMSRCRAVFFIGVGGVSMSSICRVTMGMGMRCGGSDRVVSSVLHELEKMGAQIHIGHDASHLDGYDAVVYTLAIDDENPEYAEAKRRGLPLFSRADYLGFLMMTYQHRIGIAGMHGKSTCTAMTASILQVSLDPTVLCGAPLQAGGNCSVVGHEKKHVVFEACEYRDSFLDFHPTLAVVLNIGMDHVDYFHTMDQVRASFLAYAKRTGDSGTLLMNADDPESRLTFATYAGKKASFSLERQGDFNAVNLENTPHGTSFEMTLRGEHLCRVYLQVFGKHNVYNALAAGAAALLAGASVRDVKVGLERFRGAGRRMERKGTFKGAQVYDDYAHHPDEIKATLSAAREMTDGRLVCVFQPHTYSRTAGLLAGFSKAFMAADRVIFAPIYAAREENTCGISSADIATRIGEKADSAESLASIVVKLSHEVEAGDLLLIMGAGDIDGIFPLLGL